MEKLGRSYGDVIRGHHLFTGDMIDALRLFLCRQHATHREIFRKGGSPPLIVDYID